MLGPREPAPEVNQEDGSGHGGLPGEGDELSPSTPVNCSSGFESCGDLLHGGVRGPVAFTGPLCRPGSAPGGAVPSGSLLWRVDGCFAPHPTMLHTWAALYGHGVLASAEVVGAADRLAALRPGWRAWGPCRPHPYRPCATGSSAARLPKGSAGPCASCRSCSGSGCAGGASSRQGGVRRGAPFDLGVAQGLEQRLSLGHPALHVVAHEATGVEVPLLEPAPEDPCMPGCMMVERKAKSA